MRHLVPLLVSFYLPAILGAAGVGTSGADFLKIPSATRPAALAGAASALAQGVEAMEYNPARLAAIEDWDLSANHLSWAEGISLEQVGLGWGRKGYGGALSLISLSTPEVAQTDALGLQTGTFKQQDMAYSGGVAGSWGHWSAGLLGRGLSRAIAGYSYSGMEGDVGLGWAFLPGWRAGFAVQHLGSLSALADVADATPLTLRGGIGWEGVFSNGLGLSVESDVVQPNDSSLQVRSGAQVGWSMLFLRLGGQWSQAWDGRQPFTAGAGFRWGDLQLDYTFADVVGLGTSQRFGLSWRPGVKPAARRIGPPTQLKAKRMGPDLAVTWEAQPEAKGYWVYIRKVANGNIERMGKAPLLTAQVRLKGAGRATELGLAVQSVDLEGRLSEIGPEIRVRAGQSGAEQLAAPLGLKMEDATDGKKRLSWQAASDEPGVVFLVLMSRRSGDGYAPLGKPQAGTSVLLSGASLGKDTRFFVVQALKQNEGGGLLESPFSKEWVLNPR